MADDPVELKLSAARTRLILDKPFLGALVLRLPMIAADPNWCRTTATDARAFYYNREFIGSLPLDYVQFMLAHEALHCALSHFARRQHRVRHRWDVACDHAINPLLVEDGFKAPAGVLLLDEFRGMTAEEIYPYIQDDTDEETIDDHAYDDAEGGQDGDGNHPNPPTGRDREADRPANEPDTSPGKGSTAEPDRHSGGAPPPPPLSATEREQLSVQWQERMAGAAQMALQAGKLSGSLARLVDHLLQPQLPWRMLLARYMTAMAHDDYSYMRPSRREGAAILPSLRSSHINIMVILDVSGSIKETELGEFLSEVNAIKGQIHARVTLQACDDQLAADGPWVYEAWEEVALPRSFPGGGGTDFRPVFEWVNQSDQAPDLLVFFTDGQGAFPDHEPAFPVLWLVKGKTPVPWGQRIQLN